MAIKITSSPLLLKRYPDAFPGQCMFLKNTCTKCGTRFPEGQAMVTCPKCSADRERCRNKVMPNENCCRIHAEQRTYSLYKTVAASIGDAALEEFIEKEEFDLTQEFALAKIAITGALSGTTPDPKSLMKLLTQFFAIAERKKKIDQGEVINLTWNDDLVNELRKTFRRYVNSLAVTLEAKIPIGVALTADDKANLVKEIFAEVRAQTHLLGNQLTMPPTTEM